LRAELLDGVLLIFGGHIDIGVCCHWIWGAVDLLGDVWDLALGGSLGSVLGICMWKQIPVILATQEAEIRRIQV
jgi:hypothetical protein